MRNTTTGYFNINMNLNSLKEKYDYLFEGGVLSMYDIITIFEIKRESSGSKELFIDNISKDKLVQIGCKIGSPNPLLT